MDAISIEYPVDDEINESKKFITECHDDFLLIKKIMMNSIFS